MNEVRYTFKIKRAHSRLEDQSRVSHIGSRPPSLALFLGCTQSSIYTQSVSGLIRPKWRRLSVGGSGSNWIGRIDPPASASHDRWPKIRGGCDGIGISISQSENRGASLRGISTALNFNPHTRFWQRTRLGITDDSA